MSQLQQQQNANVLEAAKSLGFEIDHPEQPLRVLSSNAGFYIGTVGEDGPCSRESACYYKTRQAAQDALERGDWPLYHEGLLAYALESSFIH